MAQKGLGVALGSLLAREVDLIATHATPRGLELEKLESEGTGEVQLPSSTWSASMQLRGRFSRGGTPDLMVFMTTKDEMRGWIRALEWVLTKA